MPQGRKVARSNNNKKKKGKHNGAGNKPPQMPPTRSTAGTAAAALKKKPVTTTVFSQAALDEANWSEFANPPQEEQGGDPPSLNLQGYHSIYDRYKNATKRFKDGLRSLVPKDIFQGDFVQCLVDAVDYLYENQLTNFSDSLIKDLKLAIRVRKRVAKEQYQGGDDGHAYFLTVLLYCFAVLRQLKPLVKRVRPSVVQEKDANENRFSALSMAEDDDNDQEDDLPSGKVTKPVAPERALPITLAELMSASDREAAVLFLMTLDEIMGFNVQQYTALKHNWTNNKRNNYPPSVIIEDILEASTAANFGIQYVQFLEEKLTTDYPHMNTIYRLMAVLVLPELTEKLTKEVLEQSPIASKFQPTDAKMFLGDCLEKSVRNPSDPVMKNIAVDFCQKWQISEKTMEYYLEGMEKLVAVELPIGNTRELNRSMFEHLRQEIGPDVTEGSWLSRFDFIGKSDRSILMTTKLLQGFSNVIHERNGHLISRKGFFGKSWNETPSGMAKRIVQDMDELMMGEILPVLINVCYGGLLRQKLPHEDELLPFFALLRDYVMKPHKPVSWALVFAVHTLATSIFEVQGNNTVHEIAEEAESCFNLYFEQLSMASDAMKAGSQPKNWEENMKRMQVLKMLVAPPTLKPSREQTLRGFWNPFCAGNFLGYLAYFANLAEGSWMVDCFAQLRMVLHLYNALKDVGLAPVDPQGILELLDSHFQNSKAVWEGPKPTRGSFVQRWWVAFGTEVKEAKRMSAEAADRFTKGRGGPPSNASRRRLQETARRMTPIEPAKLAKSFRRIMNRDFTDVVDKYHQTAAQKASPVYDHAVRCNDTLDAIDEDQTYLAMNMTALGAHLNSFIDQFFDHYWREQVQMIVRMTPDSVRFGRRADGRRVARQSWETSDANIERLAMVYIFAEEILARLDFIDLSEPDPVIVQAVAGMTYFFSQLPPYCIMYFTPTRVQDDDDDDDSVDQ